MEIHFQNLELIPHLLKELQFLKNELQKLTSKDKPNLTKLQEVAKYLKVTKPTIYNMIADGRLKQNIHYKKQINKNSVKIIFIESAIINFNKDL